MNKEEIRVTPVWQLYEIGRNYHRRTGIYTDTDRNFRFYNGNQWDGAKLGGVEPIQKNFIKPIVKYKVSVIHNHLYGIVYSSQNFDNPGNQQESGKLCEMLNRYAARAWEKDSMDFKGRRITKHSAINDEGILYINFDEETMTPVNEVISKSDIYYGNENDDDIQNQPYILIRRRMPVANAIDLALSLGMSEDDEPMIIGDNDTFEQSGEAAKEELDNMVTIVYKMYRKGGTVHFSAATRWVEIVNDVDTGLTLYPVAHFVWEEKEGSARGEGEVRYLIPNQIEVNRTEMRRVLTVKEQAYPMKVVDVSRVANPSALDTVGGTVRTNGQPVDDVRKIVGTIPPAQMSPDVKLLQDDLINVTRDLAGAGDTATGQVNPESASGRAILAVQQASQAPMTEQKESYKKFIEDVARIWLEYLIVYAEDGVNLEQAEVDPMTGQEMVRIVNVPQAVLKQLKAVVKIDVTPRSPFDRFAQEQTIENLLVQGFFNAQRVGELDIYERVLPDDSVAPKRQIRDAINYVKEEQRKIARIQARADMLMQNANNFISADPDGQAQQMVDARKKNMIRQLQMQQMAKKQTGESEVEKAEKALPDEN